MDFHLDRKLRFQNEPEHKGLYSWAINELDDNDNVVGRDQIPWVWTLHFRAKSCVLSDGLELISKRSLHEGDEAPQAEITQSQVIRATLRPSPPRDDGDYFRETKYSMFGTGRVINEFQLVIHPVTDPSEKENCSAWGSPSYTADIDYRDETIDDCVVFYLFVKPETFSRYVEKILDGSVDEIVLAVGAVDGFYSEWSPSVSTREVKILTQGDEHKLEIPADAGIVPPRLGSVGDAKLYINRCLNFGKATSNDEMHYEDNRDLGATEVVPEARKKDSDASLKILKAITFLNNAVWWAVALLALVFVTLIIRI